MHAATQRLNILLEVTVTNFTQTTKLWLLALTCATMFGCASTKPPPQSEAAAGQYNHLLAKSSPANVAKPEQSKLDAAKSSAEAKTKAQQAMRDSNDEKAIFYYVKALEFDAKDLEALLTIGAIHARNASYGPASAAYKMALDVEPQNIEALEGLGLAILKSGRYDESRRLLEQVVALDSNRVRSILGLGLVHDVKRDFVTANSYYSLALKIAPNTPAVLNNYAYSLYLSGAWDKAEQIFLKLLNRNPAHYHGALNFGLLQARRNQLKEALATLERVLPRAAAYNELGYIVMLDGQYDTAERLYELAMVNSASYFPRAYENLEFVRALRANQRPATDSLKASVLHIKQLPSVTRVETDGHPTKEIEFSDVLTKREREAQAQPKIHTDITHEDPASAPVSETSSKRYSLETP